MAGSEHTSSPRHGAMAQRLESHENHGVSPPLNPNLPERFKSVSLLGEGGMGVVYEVYDSERNERVALKTIRETHGNAAYRLKREFRAIAEIEHPNIVRLYDLFVENDRCFFTMEHLKGADVARWVASALPPIGADQETMEATTRRFDERALRHAIAGIAAGIEALHEAGLVHRDLKPSNVMVTEESRVVVLDFGLVADAHASAQQTLAGTVAGTVHYMAPEQARGETELSRAVDTYAIGVMLFEMLTAQLPFEGSALAIMAAKQTRQPPRPSERAPGVPRDLDDLTVALLAFDPLQRPPIGDVRRIIGPSMLVRSSPGIQRPASSTPPSKDGPPPIFGRDEELAEMMSALAATADGVPHVLLLRGASGIGKSALLQSFARHAEREQRAIVFSGRCHERETVPFKGLDGVVDALSRYLSTAAPEVLGRLLPPQIADLGTLFPVLRRIAPIAAAYARRASSKRSLQRVRADGFACLAELLRRIAEGAPLVIIVDDVQWADDDTAVGLLELLRGEWAPSALLLLGTRPTDQSPVEIALFGPAIAAPLRAISRTTRTLGNLDVEAIERIVRRELGRGTDESVISAIARESRGNPFAAGELVRFLREGADDDRNVVEALGTSADAIDDLVRRRAGSLDKAARALLDAVCVAGEPTETAVLLGAAGIDPGDRRAIERLRANHWIRAVRVGATTALDTVHDRVREAIVAGLTSSDRAAIHRSLATSLETLVNPPHDRLARHFAASGDRALACHHAIEAAREAQVQLALRRASELYELAIGLAPEEKAREIYPQYAESLTAAGRYVAAGDAWLAASRVAHGDEARERLRQAGQAKLHAGRIDEGLALLEASARAYGVRIWRNRFLAVMDAIIERLRLRLRGLSVAVRPRAEIAESDRRRVLGLVEVTHSYVTLELIMGLGIQARAVREALDLGDVVEASFALGSEISFRALAGDARAAEAGLRVLRAIEQLPAEVSRHVELTCRLALAIASDDARPARRIASEFAGSIGKIDHRDFRKSGEWTMYGMAIEDSLSIAAWEPLVRFVAYRDESAGPGAEIRNKAGLLVRYALLLGQTDQARAWANDSAWAADPSRIQMQRVIAAMYDSWALLYDGQLEESADRLDGALAFYRGSLAGLVPVVNIRYAARLAASGLALGRKDLALRARRSLRWLPRGLTSSSHVLLVHACIALTEAQGAVSALRRTASSARENSRDFVEAAAEWALGRIVSTPDAERHRARYLELIDGSGIVDPDRFMWSVLPVGEAPARRNSTRSEWH